MNLSIDDCFIVQRQTVLQIATVSDLAAERGAVFGGLGFSTPA